MIRFLLSCGLFLVVTSANAAGDLLPKIREGDPLPADLFVRLAKLINPEVVNINTTQLPKNVPGQPGMRPFQRDPFFELFENFMGPQFAQPRPVQSLGTGFIIREDGLILTNNHVVDQADVIKVQLDENSKELFDAKVIGQDAKTDIALIKISTKRKLSVARLGSSSSLQVGEWVAAFGNPYGHGHTMTKGIVSAIGREIDEINLFPFIQTDASINPGNSGGPLVNTQGEVIGVNTAIDPRGQGLGFAIPIDNVKALLPDLEKDGKIRRGFIGIYMADLDAESAKTLGIKQTEGALVTQVIEGSPADRAGLKAYDLIYEFNGKKIESTANLSKVVASTAVGQTVVVGFIRNGKKSSVKIAIDDNPNRTKEARNAPKKFKGQKAPYRLGFSVTDYSQSLAENFGLPALRQPAPVIVEVDPGSPAAKSGLAPGDIILDINRTPVSQAAEALKLLKPNSNNILRILKGQRVVLIYLRPF